MLYQGQQATSSVDRCQVTEKTLLKTSINSCRIFDIIFVFYTLICLQIQNFNGLSRPKKMMAHLAKVTTLF